SGPTFAHEVAAGLPTAVTLACSGGEEQWNRLKPVIARPQFRPYYSDDVIGAEIGGAVKNVLAIACGVVDGLGLGQNARAALIARGYAEMLRFGEALGAGRDTLAGLCGLGDLVLTCSSTSSRNFSLGKAYDDTGDYDKASRQFREGNAIRHRLARKWSRKHWRRSVEARLAAPPISTQLDATPGFTPIFIVGMPRSGTTLLAELLSRRAGVCNRGELATLHGLATSLELGGVPEREALQRAAAKYAQQSRQDDASGARWFLDKQPLNFRYVDLALALFPDAKIIHCQRNPRDTALSLWMQCFLEDAQGYSYDFSDIALVMRDATRMMRRWHARHPTAIQSIRYEEMVVAPQTSMTALGEWLGLPDPASRPTAP
ncbi:MAG: hypothetical protein B7X57_11025, partial [Erythrobacter sp. 34-65-8]